MTPLLMVFICLLMVGTSFLSGLFGMAGGMILIGALFLVMPVPAAMVLHAVTQMASNGWRGILWRRHVRWRVVAAYSVGCIVALSLWSLTQYVPSKPVAYIFLGAAPFVVRAMPKSLSPNPEKLPHATLYGSLCTAMMLLTGVSGPLLDTFFLGGTLDRREIVATKAFCQVLGHLMKLAYFGGIVADAAAVDPVLAIAAILASMLGTTLAKRFLEGMTDKFYRLWANRIVTTIAGYFVIHGTYMLVAANV